MDVEQSYTEHLQALQKPEDWIYKVDASQEGKSLCFFPFLSHPGYLQQPPSLCKIQL